MAAARALDHGSPGTPLAWQQRDLNYQAGGHHDRYGGTHPHTNHHAHPYDRYTHAPQGPPSRMGPPSTSDRLSHRSGDKSWGAAPPMLVPYPPSRPSGSSGRPPSRPRSPSATSSSSSSSSSSSTEESERVGAPGPPMMYPGMYPPGPHGPPGHPGTVKSARSVPALALATWDGEPCPVHGGGPLPMPYPGPPPMGPPPPRRGGSIYDLRGVAAAPYATLPARPLPGDRRSLAGSGLAGPPAPGAPPGIPPHLLPPMARPLPLVVDEKGHAEPLPVRRTADKGVVAAVAAKAASVSGEGGEGGEGGGKSACCPGGWCVAWVILALVCGGVVLALMLRFIL